MQEWTPLLQLLNDVEWGWLCENLTDVDRRFNLIGVTSVEPNRSQINIHRIRAQSQLLNTDNENYKVKVIKHACRLKTRSIENR